ncbi:MAG: GNAT family N-acetyltransferase [Candidatus Pacebacteria bacterium]|nr:GNAT family N-acetyltransferase [Candidatus Paceibacterota bacterium]
MKTKAKGVKSKLFGMVVEEVKAGNHGQLSQIANLDQLCSQDPWSLDTWRTKIRAANIRAAVVYNNEDRVIAFVVLARGMTKVHVTDILVSPDYRRIGVGRMLLDYLDFQFLDEVRSAMEIVVDERDRGTQEFLKKCDVKAVEVLRGEPYGHYLFRRSFNPKD